MRVNSATFLGLSMNPASFWVFHTLATGRLRDMIRRPSHPFVLQGSDRLQGNISSMNLGFGSTSLEILKLQ